MSSAETGIFVGVDGSRHADSALLWAWLESQSRAVRLTAVHGGADSTTVPEIIGSPHAHGHESTVLSDAVTRLGDSLQGKHAALRPGPLPVPKDSAALNVQGTSVSGPIVPGLLEAASAGQMLVVGRRGLGRLGRIFMGSVSAGLAREAQIPVTIVPVNWPSAASPEETAPAVSSLVDAPVDAADRPRVVVGVDGSAASAAALEHGVEVARRTGAVLDAVACWQLMLVAPLPHGQGWAPPLEDYQEHVSEMLTTTLAAALVAAGPLPADQVRAVVEHASPAQGLLLHAAGAERLIVGHRGHGGFDRLLLGSVSSQMIEHAPCPVTVMRIT